MIGSDFIRDAAVIGFTANEGLSIIENAGLMGVPIPRAVVSAIHVLKERADSGARTEETADGRDGEEGSDGGHAV